MRADRLENIAKVMEEFQYRGQSITRSVSEDLDLSQRTVYKLKNYLRNMGLLIEQPNKREFIIENEKAHPKARRAYLQVNEKYMKGEVPCKTELFNPELEKKASSEIENFKENPTNENFSNLLEKIKEIKKDTLSLEDIFGEEVEL